MTKSPKQSQQPDDDVKRQMIEERIGKFRRAGFDAELEIATLKIQKTSGDKEERERTEALKNLRSTAANCYASAKELSQMLESLPAPKKEKAS